MPSLRGTSLRHFCSLVICTRNAVLLAPVRVASSCVPIYRPIPASLVTPKGATNTSVAVFHHYPNSKLLLRRTPSWPLPGLSCFIFLGRSSNSLACLVIVLFILLAWCLVPVCMYLCHTGFRSRMFNEVDSVPPSSQFHYGRLRRHLSRTAHTAMPCIHETCQVIVGNVVTVGFMSTADVLLLW